MKKITLLFIAALISTLNTNGQINFTSKIAVDTNIAEGSYDLASADLNGDEFKDIVLVNIPITNSTTSTTSESVIKIYINDILNSANFMAPYEITSTLDQIYGVAIADFNGDGFNDIVATGANNQTVAWYPNDGVGNFNTENIISNTLGAPIRVVTGLIDGDALIDIAVTDFANHTTYWFSNQGDGTFSSSNLVGTKAGSGPFDLDIADYDDDGDNDIVVGNSTDGTVEVYDNKLIGSGTVSFEKYANTVSSGNNVLQDVSFGELFNSEEIFILKANVNTPSNASYFTRSDNTTATTFNTINLNSGITRTSTANAADFNNDGLNDIVVTNGTTGGDDLTILEAKNDGTFENPVILASSLKQIFAITIDDFDNDNDLDIVTAGFRNFPDLNFFRNELIVLGIEDYEIEGIKIFPNPVNNKLTFKGLEEIENVISIFNNIGQKVIETAIDINNQIDVSNLAKGLYFLKFEGTDGTHKMIKN